MRIEVLHLIGIDAGIFQGHGHGAARAIHVGRGHVEGIAGHAKTDNFGVNPGAARLGVFVLFEHQHTAALAQHKAVTVLVPGARSRLGVFIAG